MLLYQSGLYFCHLYFISERQVLLDLFQKDKSSSHLWWQPPLPFVQVWELFRFLRQLYHFHFHWDLDHLERDLERDFNHLERGVENFRFQTHRHPHSWSKGWVSVVKGKTHFGCFPPDHPWKTSAVRAGRTDVAVPVRTATLETNFYKLNVGIFGVNYIWWRKNINILVQKLWVEQKILAGKYQGTFLGGGLAVAAGVGLQPLPAWYVIGLYNVHWRSQTTKKYPERNLEVGEYNASQIECIAIDPSLFPIYRPISTDSAYGEVAMGGSDKEFSTFKTILSKNATFTL